MIQTTLTLVSNLRADEKLEAGHNSAKNLRQEFYLNVLYRSWPCGWLCFLSFGRFSTVDDLRRRWQSGHPGKFFMYVLLVGSFGFFGIGGLSEGLKLSSRMFKSNE